MAMTRAELMEFAELSAALAKDNGWNYADPVATHQENLMDTMAEHGIRNPDYSDALDLYARLVRQFGLRG